MVHISCLGFTSDSELCAFSRWDIYLYTYIVVDIYVLVCVLITYKFVEVS